MTTLQEKLKEAIAIYRQKTAVYQNLQNELFQLEGSINTLQELIEAEPAFAPVVEEEKEGEE